MSEKDPFKYADIDFMYRLDAYYDVNVRLYNESVARPSTNHRRLIISGIAKLLARFPKKEGQRIEKPLDIAAIAFNSTLRNGSSSPKSYKYIFDQNDLDLIQKFDDIGLREIKISDLTEDELSKEIQMWCLIGASDAKYYFFLADEYKKLTGSGPKDLKMEVEDYTIEFLRPHSPSEKEQEQNDVTEIRKIISELGSAQSTKLRWKGSAKQLYEWIRHVYSMDLIANDQLSLADFIFQNIEFINGNAPGKATILSELRRNNPPAKGKRLYDPSPDKK